MTELASLTLTVCTVESIDNRVTEANTVAQQQQTEESCVLAGLIGGGQGYGATCVLHHRNRTCLSLSELPLLCPVHTFWQLLHKR